MKLKIHTQIIIAIALGIIIGLAFPQFAQKLQIIGDLFIKLLKMIIVPLIATSIISGVAGMRIGLAILHPGRLSRRAASATPWARRWLKCWKSRIRRRAVQPKTKFLSVNLSVVR